MATARERLQSLSWFMKCLKEPLSRLANREEQTRGAFFEGRFKSVAILDEESLLATCAYIDLNPVAAGIARGSRSERTYVDQERVSSTSRSRGEPRICRPPQAGSVAGSRAAAGLEESLWLCPIEDRRRLDSSREGMLEGFSLGNYLLLVDYTGRLFREGKAAISAELAGIFDRLGSSAESWQARLREAEPRAGCWAVSSPPAEPGCGKSPSVWACTTWRTWAAARCADADPKAGFQARLYFTLPETLGRVRRSCRKLCISGSFRPSLSIRYEKQARVSPRPNGGARVDAHCHEETWPPDMRIAEGLSISRVRKAGKSLTVRSAARFTRG